MNNLSFIFSYLWTISNLTRFLRAPPPAQQIGVSSSFWPMLLWELQSPRTVICFRPFPLINVASITGQHIGESPFGWQMLLWTRSFPSGTNWCKLCLLTNVTVRPFIAPDNKLVLNLSAPGNQFVQALLLGTIDVIYRSKLNHIHSRYKYCMLYLSSFSSIF